MNRYWRNVFEVIDALGERYRPVYRTYVVTDMLTAPPGTELGDTVEYVEYPPLGGWELLP